MRLFRSFAAVAGLALAACAPSEPALAQPDTVKVQVEVPTVPVADTVALRATRDSLVQLQGHIAQDSADKAQLMRTLAVVMDSANAARLRASTTALALAAAQHRADSLAALPPPVPPPPVHDTTHDTVTTVKIVAINVSYDSLAVDSMKIWRVDTNPPVPLDAMPLTVGESVPIRVDCFNHAKQQISCPADLKVTSSDPSVATVTMPAPPAPPAPSTPSTPTTP